MSQIYTESHRSLQDEFDARDLADRLEAAILMTELGDDQADFIHSRNMFFLSTLDETGHPTVSFKGGAPGFVRVLNPQTLVFPAYDGNGMFLSLGNIQAQEKVGLLFIDFETPRRLRLQGTAKLLRSGPLLETYPGAIAAVEVQVRSAWVNCARYIPKLRELEPSPHLPAEDGTARIAAWKRVDLIQDVLTEADRIAARAAGIITIEDYEALVASGRS